jgi:hypothetical protein
MTEGREYRWGTHFTTADFHPLRLPSVAGVYQEETMRALTTILVGAALLIASTAYADRIFDLEGTVTLRAVGERITDNVSGTLTLFDDRTYTLNQEGSVSSGIWLEEGKKIQLFQDEPTVSEFIAELEQEVSDAAGMAISVTSLIGKEKITRTRTGDITVRVKSTYTFRPGPREGRPLKIKMSEKLVGTLQ